MVRSTRGPDGSSPKHPPPPARSPRIGDHIREPRGSNHNPPPSRNGTARNGSCQHVVPLVRLAPLARIRTAARLPLQPRRPLLLINCGSGSSQPSAAGDGAVSEFGAGYSRSYCNTITNHSSGGRCAICLTIKCCCCLAFSKQPAAPVLLEVPGCDPSVTLDNKSAVRRQLAPHCKRNSFKLPFGILLLSHLRLRQTSSKYVNSAA